MSQKQVSTFNFKSNPVRIEIIKNEPYFCLVDVCLVMNIQNSRRVNADMLNQEGVRKAYAPTISGNQELTFINEPNLYRIIFKSRKTEAVEFQNWVFEKVLPQIRKTGQYSQISAQAAPLDPNQIQLSKDKYIALLEKLVEKQEQTVRPQYFKRRLTLAEKRQIISLHQQGLTTYEICQQVGRSDSAVRATIHQYTAK